MSDRPIPPLLHEITPEQFQLWKRHPVSELVLSRYLPEYRQAHERDLMAAWKAGKTTLANEQFTRGYLTMMEKMERITLDAILNYYGVTEDFAERMRRSKL